MATRKSSETLENVLLGQSITNFPESLTWQFLGQVCAVLAVDRLVVIRNFRGQPPEEMATDLMMSE